MGLRLHSDGAAAGAVGRSGSRWTRGTRHAWPAAGPAGSVRDAAGQHAGRTWKLSAAAAARIRTAQSAADHSAERSIWKSVRQSQSESERAVPESQRLDDLHACDSWTTS